MSNVYKIFKLARKFQFKMAIAAGMEDYVDISKAEDKLREILQQMKLAIENAPELNDFILKFPAAVGKKDPMFKEFFSQKEKNIEQFLEIGMSPLRSEDLPARPESIQAMQDCIKMVDLIENTSVSAPLSELSEKISEIYSILHKLAAPSGVDAFGVNQPNYLNIRNAFLNFYSIMKNYHFVGEVNSFVKREVESQIGRITNTLYTLGRLAVKAGEIIEKVKGERFLTVKEEKSLSDMPLLGDTSRSVKSLENHEITHLLQIIDVIPPDWSPAGYSHLAVGLLNREVRFYNEIIKPFQAGRRDDCVHGDMVLLCRRIWNNPQFKKLWRHTAMRDTELKNSILSIPSISNKIDTLKSHISEQMEAIKNKNKKEQERHFGSPEPVEMPKRLDPLEIINKINSSLSKETRDLLNNGNVPVKLILRAIQLGELDMSIIDKIKTLDADTLRDITSVEELQAL